MIAHRMSGVRENMRRKMSVANLLAVICFLNRTPDTPGLS
jgi:hypothetical protein